MPFPTCGISIQVWWIVNRGVLTLHLSNYQSAKFFANSNIAFLYPEIFEV
jgi:hypothetical protein